MKKYLMTGIAALALCAGFTSCSHDLDAPSQEDINKSEAQKIVNNYNEAFLKYVGNISADQNWGFGGYTHSTRSINVNGNLWEDCPTVGTTEEDDVVAWVANHHDNTTAPSGLTNYFVTQIHKGTETYNNVGNGYVGVGSDKMNNLHIAMTSSASITNGALSAEGWDHINNFNAGTCNDWNGGSDGHGNTLVLGGGTFDFAYEGAEDSKYHNRWCAVRGADIDPKYAGYYYICFDFEQTANTQTVFRIQFDYVHDNGNGGTQTDNKNEMFTLTGSYQTAAEIVTAMGGKFTYEGKEYTLTANMINNINIESGNQQVNPNSSYQDWIIRLVEAQPEIVENPTDVCIFAEDLSATTGTDFDFNDVVFTVHYDTESTATVTLYAAGGTLPLTVAGQEVHAKFGYPNPDEKGLYKMINTGAKADVNNVPTVSFQVSSQRSTRGKDITIMVDKGKKNDEGVYVPNWIELTATGGAPAAKVCVGVDYATGHKWCEERQSIKTVYNKFSQWVADSPTLIWWRNN